MRLRLAACLVTACSFAFGQAPETTKTAKILELFRLTHTDQMQKQVLAQMSAAMDPEHRPATEKLMAFVFEKMSWDAMKPAYIKLYDDTFTEDEISGILLFYESAPGQAYLAKTPLLLTNMMTLVQKRMAELKPEMDRLAREAAGVK